MWGKTGKFVNLILRFQDLFFKLFNNKYIQRIIIVLFYSNSQLL